MKLVGRSVSIFALLEFQWLKDDDRASECGGRGVISLRTPLVDSRVHLVESAVAEAGALDFDIPDVYIFKAAIIDVREI